MPFNSLFLTSLTSDNSFTRSGVHLKFDSKPHVNEKIIFFEIDDQHHKSTFKKDLNFEGGICDFIALYFTKELCNSTNEKTLCLVELKSGTMEKAIDQVKNTLKILKSSLAETLDDKECKKYLKNIKWKVFIILSHSTSVHVQTSIVSEKLIKELGLEDCQISKDENIGIFLRKTRKRRI